MSEYDPSTYGDRIAEIYDRRRRVSRNTEATVAFLAALAKRGPVLELGIGTGRIALPLAKGGIEVHGIDASRAMVAKLREKPGGERIPVALGDFADVPIEGLFLARLRGGQHVLRPPEPGGSGPLFFGGRPASHR
jgi:16S rRNA A1518/A1519 N6-dimethyltransferase RsmA/KsgA/DIM1 with predicted DNA glycosylase/AP lyase activity